MFVSVNVVEHVTFVVDYILGQLHSAFDMFIII